MKIYLMRHGPAEDAAHSGFDSDRSLTPSGRDRVLAVAKLLRDLGEAPAHTMTSPLVRAVQTAEIVALGSKLDTAPGASVEVRRELEPENDAVRLVNGLAVGGLKRVLLVGHEPDLSLLVTALVGTLRRPFEKAMVVGIHLSSDSSAARLRFVIDPQTLRVDRTPE